MYLVTEAAKRLGVSASTVRNLSNDLEREGVKIRRDYRGHRIYNDNDIVMLKNVQRGNKNKETPKVVGHKPINVNKLRVKEYKSQRLVTLKDIDLVHGRPEGTASRTFTAHKSKLIEGEDYFVIKHQNNEFRGLETIPNRGLTLLTESGYLMLVKSFTDDLAWQVQRQLVNSYFRNKAIEKGTSYSYMIEDPIERAKRWIEEQEEKLMLEQRIAEYEPKITYYDKILQSTDCLTVTQIAKDYGLTAQELNKILHKEGIQYKLSKQWLLYRKYANQGYTKTETTPFVKHDGTTGTSLLTKWTQKGRLFIHELLTGLGYDPDDLNNNEG